MHHLAISEFRRNETARRILSDIEQRYRAPEPDTEREALIAIALERCWQALPIADRQRPSIRAPCHFSQNLTASPRG